MVLKSLPVRCLTLLLLAGYGPMTAQPSVPYHVRLLAGSDWVGDGGPARDAILLQAEGLAAGADGALYIADAQTHRVRKITPDGIIHTIAGTGVAGLAGDGGPATEAQLHAPYGLALDAAGNLYIADLGNARVRRVARDGSITTVAGGGLLTPGGGNEGAPATSFRLLSPRAVAVDAAGNLFVADFEGQRVLVRYPSGALRTLAGTGAPGKNGDGGPALLAVLNFPAALAVDPHGALYIGDSQNHAIRIVEAGGTIRTLTTVATPTGLALDTAGALYVADAYSGQLLRVSATGLVTALPIAARAVTVAPNGSWYASDGQLVRNIAPTMDGYVVIAGRGNPAHGDQGPATGARLSQPSAVAVDASGDVYIADRGNQRVRRVQSDGVISTVAGTGIAGDGGDGGLASRASLDTPVALSVDAQGNIFLAQNGGTPASGNRVSQPRIRRFTSAGAMLAVTETPDPRGVASDSRGNVYLTDGAAGKIFRITPAGGLLSVASGLVQPRALAAVPENGLYFVDQAGAQLNHLAGDGRLTRIPAPGRFLTGIAVAPSDAASSAGGGPANAAVFVTDANLGQVLRLEPGGGLRPLELDGALGLPSAIAADANGLLYVSDSAGGRVWVLEPQLPPSAVIAPRGRRR